MIGRMREDFWHGSAGLSAVGFGWSGLGLARQGRRGIGGQRYVRSGTESLFDADRNGKAGSGAARMHGSVMTEHCAVRLWRRSAVHGLGKAGKAWPGMSGSRVVRFCLVRRGTSARGATSHGEAKQAAQVSFLFVFGSGWSGQSKAWHGEAGKARLGKSWQCIVAAQRRHVFVWRC